MKLEAFPRKSEVVGRAAVNIAGGVKGRVLAGVLLLVAFGTACGGAASGGSSNETAGLRCDVPSAQKEGQREERWPSGSQALSSLRARA